ncbi:hypothetical protein HID58_074123 [Brassica napus]|uniref:Uncharacterized protein n=1 Tax=Brassica napus TaxID=3708 RepID=A0ABQ7YIU1_BRANA|nr:hypothetical protein HID58_074123 [Brassica napus]
MAVSVQPSSVQAVAEVVAPAAKPKEGPSRCTTCNKRYHVAAQEAISKANEIPCVGDTVVTPVKAGQTCDDEVDVARCKLRIARCKGSEIKKYKTGDCGASVSVEVPLSELFHKELAMRTSEHLRDKRGQRRMMMMRIIWNDPLSDLSQLKDQPSQQVLHQVGQLSNHTGNLRSWTRPASSSCDLRARDIRGRDARYRDKQQYEFFTFIMFQMLKLIVYKPYDLKRIRRKQCHVLIFCSSA